MTQEYKAHLNPEQLKAAEAMGTVCVIAGAGTGKTSTLTAAIIDKMRAQKIKPDRIFATTFTKKAAAEMATRLRKFEAPVPHYLGTFHSNARKLMSRVPALAGKVDVTKLNILDPEMANAFIVKNVLNSITDDELEQARNLAATGMFRPDGVSIAALATKFQDVSSVMKMDSMSMNDLTDPEGADYIFSDLFRTKSLDNPAGAYLASLYFAKYNRMLQQNNSMDFDDLISVPTRVMRENPDIQKQVSGLFDAVFIDEDQDTNLIQQEFASYITQSADVVFRVGDDGQSIYGWRGSHVSILRDFKDSADTVVVLHRNYRSTQAILDFSRNVLLNDPQSEDKKLIASNTKVTRQDPAPITTIDCGPSAKIWNEGDVIAGMIGKRVAKGQSPSKFAIICRTNAAATICYHKLLNRNIPAVCDADDIFRLKIVRFLIAYAIAATYPDDSVNALRLDDLFSNPYMPNMKMGEKTRDKLAALISEKGDIVSAIGSFKKEVSLRYRKKADEALTTLVQFIDDMAREKRRLKVEELDASYVFKHALSHSGLKAEIAARKNTIRQSLEKLSRAPQYARREEDQLKKDLESIENAQAHITEFLSIVDGVSVREAIEIVLLAKETKVDDGKPRVRVTTIHKAKGLEWDVVFVPGATTTVLFYRAEPGTPEYNEAVRCMYVAFTRPRHELIITHSEHELVEEAQKALDSDTHADMLYCYGALINRAERDSEASMDHEDYDEEDDEY